MRHDATAVDCHRVRKVAFWRQWMIVVALQAFE
ncbi:hypothetical protein AF72_02945 [Xylella taiwanensis]|uniref:Uncharacterized protein n=1 Tax=Xylella taiwanensis TaxID=1444770 RepID=Z9JKI1_9GAMM|nr:hypothetical protein AF72_02945 [Xylella taiwanensis]